MAFVLDHITLAITGPPPVTSSRTTLRAPGGSELMALLEGRSVWNYRLRTSALSRTTGELQQDFFTCHQRRPITESCRPNSTIDERASDAPTACCLLWEPFRGTSESWPIDLPCGVAGLRLHCEEQRSVVHRRLSEQPRLSRPNATVHRAAANDIEFRNRAARGSVWNGLFGASLSTPCRPRGSPNRSPISSRARTARLETQTRPDTR